MKDRKKETLLNLIFNHIDAGSIIYSDMWKAYNDISKLDKNFTHKMVNHSLHFVDPTTGTHTNTIESMWKTCKMKIKQMCGVDRRYVQHYLDEFVWRYSNYADRTTLFDCIIKTIPSTYASKNENIINEKDFDDLSDVSYMSEDEEEKQQRKEWVEKQRQIRQEENEDSVNIEEEIRKESLVDLKLSEDTEKVEREKLYLEKKAKENEKKEKQKDEEKKFEEEVENICNELKDVSFEFKKLTIRKRQIVHQVAERYNLIHVSTGEDQERKLKIKKKLNKNVENAEKNVENAEKNVENADNEVDSLIIKNVIK